MKNIRPLFFVVLVVFLVSFSTPKNIKKQDPKITKKDSILKKKEAIPTTILDSTIFYKGKFKPYKKNAHASYYHEKFNGRRTASGKKYNSNELTAAHKKLPFGTKLKLTNEANKKSIIVEVTDRGPYVKGREIDLSKRAFMAITSSKGSGQVIVTIEELKK